MYIYTCGDDIRKRVYGPINARRRKKKTERRTTWRNRAGERVNGVSPRLDNGHALVLIRSATVERSAGGRWWWCPSVRRIGTKRSIADPKKGYRVHVIMCVKIRVACIRDGYYNNMLIIIVVTTGARALVLKRRGVFFFFFFFCI